MLDLAHQVYLKKYSDERGAANFSEIVRLLKEQPAFRTRKNKDADLQSAGVLLKLATSFNKGRDLKNPTVSESPHDPAMCIVAESWFSVPNSHLTQFFDYHKQAMGIENIIGAYLEAYIYESLWNEGWIWCSGSIVNKVDFIKVSNGRFEQFLQIKCRDNTENSSSLEVREGTKISKWFRFFSKTGQTNWLSFPDSKGRLQLSEEGFLKFLKKKLRGDRL
jgi:hypothetical protein